jgi:predicted nucleotidyltransferase component of viral defense system
MNSGNPPNSAQAVRDKLKVIATRRGTEFQRVLSEFAVERLLFRLGASPHGTSFVLKGATLFRLWDQEERRATWDLDLLGEGDSEVAAVVRTVKEICAIENKDGIVFDLNSLHGEEIRHLDHYGGVRVRMQALLGAAKIPVQIDVGFGDVVTPSPNTVAFPVLLGHAPPLILVYPWPSVVAEKLEAAVSLGLTNSRMKDFYDLWVIGEFHAFSLNEMVQAVQATFQRRKSPIPIKLPVVFTAEFLGESGREAQWRAFLSRSRLGDAPDVVGLAASLQAFLIPIINGATSDQLVPMFWSPGGPWRRGAGGEERL